MKNAVKLIIVMILSLLVFGCEFGGTKPINNDEEEYSYKIYIDNKELDFENPNIDMKVDDELLINIEKEVIKNNKSSYSIATFNIDINNDKLLDVLNVDGKTYLKALHGGTVGVTLKLSTGEEYQIVISITGGIDLVNPEIIINEEINRTVSLFENFDPLKNVQALDDIDGDITDRIEITGSVDTSNYGTYELEYKVEDAYGNQTVVQRNITVVWDYAVTFIGHAGSYYGIMNSEEAILYAINNLKYQAVEVDLKQTKDGVFVLSHDDDFNGVDIASTNYKDLKDVVYTASRKAGYPYQNGSVVKDQYSTKICTLERYLNICKETNTVAVIELKSSKGITNSDQSRMQALMNEIEACGMLNQVIFLASQYNCLIWTRQNGYEYIPCQYLVNSCESETILNRCINYDLDVSINVTGTATNSDEWLARYKAYDIKISTYTFTQYVNYDVVQSWINKEVDFVTCDWHLISRLSILKKTSEIQYHTVKFMDNDGTLLKEVQVKNNRTAVSPIMTDKPGYKFIGWDKDITNVTEDLVVTALYELEVYNITYVTTVSTISQGSWDSKDDFINDFYGDFFNWISENYQKIGMTLSSGTYSYTLHGVTVTFKDKDDIIAIDKYNYEKTLSNLIYKPVTRLSDDSCEIVLDENYFLNSSKYLEKYRAVDAWLINCINVGYPSYDKTYTPTSAGKIQIFFRMHQWVQGTNINPFNTLPVKYIEEVKDYHASMPTKLTYTIEDEFVLETITGDKEFIGWFTDKNYQTSISSIEKGSYGDLVLYAGWE